MTLSIDDPETERLVRDLAELAGESPTEAVRKAVEARLGRRHWRERDEAGRPLTQRIEEIAKRYAALPDLDPRSADEIVGYDEHGMW